MIVRVVSEGFAVAVGAAARVHENLLWVRDAIAVDHCRCFAENRLRGVFVQELVFAQRGCCLLVVGVINREFFRERLRWNLFGFLCLCGVRELWLLLLLLHAHLVRK